MQQHPPLQTSTLLPPPSSLSARRRINLRPLPRASAASPVPCCATSLSLDRSSPLAEPSNSHSRRSSSSAPPSTSDSTPPSPASTRSTTPPLARSTTPPLALAQQRSVRFKRPAPRPHPSSASEPNPHSKPARAAAARILRGHRPPPHPPMSQPNTLVGTLMDGGQASAASASAPERRGSHAFDPIASTFDLRKALQTCADPTMSWSLQFWVTIADPLTNDVFFACPASGQCSWEPPVGAFVVPRSPDGEWWELADQSRDNQSYYYNTLTGATQWDRPENDAFVIPLGLIQRNALPAQPRRSSSSSPQKSSGKRGSVGSGSVRFSFDGGLPVPGLSETKRMSTSSSGPLTPIIGSPTEETFQPSWWERRTSKSRLWKRPSKSKLQAPSPETSPALSSSNGTVGSPVVASPQHLSSTVLSSPDVEDGSRLSALINESAINLILQPASPTSASYHDNWSTDNFADRYFATKRTGVMRHRMSLERIMEWQRAPITAPLLVLTKNSVQDAITTFKVIQHVMGERDRAVDGARPPSHMPSPSMLSLRSFRDPDAGKDEKTIILEEIRWMIQLGVGRIEMRDELYCQVIKQLTRNPEKDATVLGFQLFCVFVTAFGPSKSFEPFVRSFLIGNVERPDFGIGVMSKFCLTRLDAWTEKGGRGRVLTLAEIEHASDAAFYPSVYGQTLETIMQRQEGAYPELRIPIILPFLADGILALGGTECEGIFRVPGDNDSIVQLKARIDRGQYQLNGVEDPHIVASLFKLWLRELEEPLVPTKLHEAALEASKTADGTVLFMKRLPEHNRHVLLFVISFLQLFLDPDVVAATKMTPRNLALVLAPNILRTPDPTLSAAFVNAGHECQFVLNLLQHLDPPTVDPEFVPSHGGAGRASFDSVQSGTEGH